MYQDESVDDFLEQFLGDGKAVPITRTEGAKPVKAKKEKVHEHLPPLEAPSDHRLGLRTKVAVFMIFVMIPLAIWFGITVMDDRKYSFISMAIIIFTMAPFLLVFEGRKPRARELVVIAVIVAIGVAGRAAFFMLPQFKPVVAVVIVAGVCFGAESGFLVGAMTGFASNFFLGQGPWTPWQMFAFGIIGFLAGILFKKGLLKTGKLPLCVFGFITTFIIYGLIMNTATLLMYATTITPGALYATILSGVPFDLIHAAATVFFLFVASQPMIEKLERIKIKYGLIQP